MLYFGMKPDPGDPLPILVNRPPREARCEWCHEPFAENEGGVYKARAALVMPSGIFVEDGARHWECEIRMELGPAQHIRYQGKLAPKDAVRDRPGLTRREAARESKRAYDEVVAMLSACESAEHRVN